MIDNLPKKVNKIFSIRNGKGVFTLMVLLFFGTESLLFAEIPTRKSHPSYTAGVLEIGGSTAFSADYQREQGSGREFVHLRVTPTLGYFLLDGFEIGLKASYLFDNLHETGQTDDRSQRFLFLLAPTYHFREMSDFIVPYVGIDFGTYYQRITADTTSRSYIQFAMGMEAGLRWMMTEQVGLKFGFQYIHGFREEFIGHTDWVGLVIGISMFVPTWPAY